MEHDNSNPGTPADPEHEQMNTNISLLPITTDELSARVLDRSLPRPTKKTYG